MSSITEETVQGQDSQLRITALDSLDLTQDELKSLVADWKESVDHSAGPDIVKSQHDALLTFYLNSGYFRFGEDKEYGFGYDATAIDVDEVVTEIKEEQLTDTELYALVETFYKRH